MIEIKEARFRVTCDLCGLMYESEKAYDTLECFLDEINEEGWLSRLEGETWYHYCNEC